MMRDFSIKVAIAYFISFCVHLFFAYKVFALFSKTPFLLFCCYLSFLVTAGIVVVYFDKWDGNRKKYRVILYGVPFFVYGYFLTKYDYGLNHLSPIFQDSFWVFAFNSIRLMCFIFGGWIFTRLFYRHGKHTKK